VAAGCTHVFHQYTLRISGGRRDAVARALDSAGIATQIYYPIPIHQLPVYAERKTSLPITESAASEVLSLPIYPELSSAAALEIARLVRAALEALRP
jgi:dTDP-4-amino-4,6-dideoxygalactose transaminase